MKIKKMNSRSILVIMFTLIFGATFLLDYICKENQLVYRLWLSFSILFYRYAFLIIIFIILPCYLIKKKRSILLALVGSPIILFAIFLFLINMFINPVLATKEYRTQKNGKEVIVLKKTSFITKTYSYYTSVNMFFMTHSGIPDDGE